MEKDRYTSDDELELEQRAKMGGFQCEFQRDVYFPSSDSSDDDDIDLDQDEQCDEGRSEMAAKDPKLHQTELHMDEANDGSLIQDVVILDPVDNSGTDEAAVNDEPTQQSTSTKSPTPE